MNKLTIVGVALGLAVIWSGCDRSTPTSATPTPSPTPPVTPPPVATYTLSGVVSELTPAGPAPLEGAQVVDDASRQTATTDQAGRYSMTGLTATTHLLSIRKIGYTTLTESIALQRDTQLDIRLERFVSYILSGVVFELTDAEPIPIEDVEIYCDSCGSPDGHTFVHTDVNGFYSLAWSMNGAHPLFVRKAGYEIFDPDHTLRDSAGRITAIVNGDTRFDIRMVKR